MVHRNNGRKRARQELGEGNGDELNSDISSSPVGFSPPAQSVPPATPQLPLLAQPAGQANRVLATMSWSFQPTAPPNQQQAQTRWNDSLMGHTPPSEPYNPQLMSRNYHITWGDNSWSNTNFLPQSVPIYDFPEPTDPWANVSLYDQPVDGPSFGVNRYFEGFTEPEWFHCPGSFMSSSNKYEKSGLNPSYDTGADTMPDTIPDLAYRDPHGPLKTSSDLGNNAIAMYQVMPEARMSTIRQPDAAYAGAPPSITADEELALKLQEEEFSQEVTPSPKIRMVNFAATRTLGSWEKLPWELKLPLLEQCLKLDIPLTPKNIKKLKDIHLDPFLKVSTEYAKEAEQVFYECNELRLQPMPCDSDPLTQTVRKLEISFPHPDMRVNIFVKRLEFHGCPKQTDEQVSKADNGRWGSSFVQVKPPRYTAAEWDAKRENDNWHYLKQITNGKYGFQKLELVKVFFEPKPMRMQSILWRWRVVIEVGSRELVFENEMKDWEGALEAVIKEMALPSPDSGQPCFILVRREDAKTNLVQFGKELDGFND
ncbi:uncharacterized protein BDR25DRAFT_390748 [Lindgomyces ingoldianus]|uniref:Uncharacterized protein n=1 Tax=Lindgomyces ingoldianus TaxID=673940 RepID=A0ACB6RF81_9PLEO|nr:uncharacterized protein BDR25DRAFT_390748 [Lindgomyces ingoldianus]KAF2477147.1 hypothetical protein BDR25DRAFT_390748 [Lindgomyces ingoldianus]